MKVMKLGYLTMLLAVIVLSQGCTSSHTPQGSHEADESLWLPPEDLPEEFINIPVENWPQARSPFTESLIGSSTQKVRDRYGNAKLHANADPPNNPLIGHFYCANDNEMERRWLNVWLYPNNDKIVDAYWSAYPGLPPSSKNKP